MSFAGYWRDRRQGLALLFFKDACYPFGVMTDMHPHEMPHYVADTRPFHIKADGSWWQGNDRFTRLDIVRLLANSLVRDADGSLWVARDGGRHPVVADAHAFVVIDWTVEDAGTDAQHVVFFSATGQSWVLGEDCSLHIPPNTEAYSVTDTQSLSGPPYLDLPIGLTARLAHGVYYGLIVWQLSQISAPMPQQSRLTVLSHGHHHDLGAL